MGKCLDAMIEVKEALMLQGELSMFLVLIVSVDMISTTA
jgi:hypothetical protein